MSKKFGGYEVEGCYKHEASGMVVQARRRIKPNGELAEHPKYIVMIRGAIGSKFGNKHVGNVMKGHGVGNLIKTTFKETVA